MNFSSSHRNHENRRYEDSPPQGLFEARRGRLPDFFGTVIKAAAGRPSGRRRSSQLLERVKNPKITLVQSNFHGKTFRNSDALFGHAGIPPPLWQPHRGILTHYLYEKSHNFQQSKPSRPNAPRPPTGDWWRKRGASYKKRGFPMKIALDQ